MLRWLMLACALAAVAVPGAASATTFTVTRTADTSDGTCDADCSLRDAIAAANADKAADTVVVPAGTYTLTLGALDVTESLAVTGAGARMTTLQGDGTARVISLSGSKSSFEISGLTITGGGGVAQGAGIYAEGTTTIRDAAVVGNATSQATATSSRQGAGVFLGGSAATLERVLIAGNTATSIAGDSFAPQGAGLFSGSSTTLVNVTVSGNTLDGTLGGSHGPQGAGVFINGGPTSLASVTVAGNSAVDQDSQGGGIFYNDDAVTVRHSIVAGNTAGGVIDECYVNGTVASAATNLATNAADCGFTGPADISADPLLGALADSGGTTNTRAPAPGSPAIDRVPFAECPALDQRGFARTGAGAACDLGAHEAGAPAPAPAVPSPTPAPTPSPPPKLRPLNSIRVFTLPSSKRCLSRRAFTIRIRKLKGVTFASATVLVNGKRVRAVNGMRITAPINLKGLPKGRFTVRITAIATDGRKVTGTRRYRTCTRKTRAHTRTPQL